MSTSKQPDPEYIEFVVDTLKRYPPAESLWEYESNHHENDEAIVLLDVPVVVELRIFIHVTSTCAAQMRVGSSVIVTWFTDNERKIIRDAIDAVKASEDTKREKREFIILQEARQSLGIPRPPKEVASPAEGGNTMNVKEAIEYLRGVDPDDKLLDHIHGLLGLAGVYANTLWTEADIRIELDTNDVVPSKKLIQLVKDETDWDIVASSSQGMDELARATNAVLEKEGLL